MRQAPQPIPVFRHDFIITKNFSREVIRTVIHAILFHRVFGSVQPKEVEVLGITFPQVVESEIEDLVNQRTERAVVALEHKTPSILLSIRFLETRLNPNNKDDKSWFKSSSSSPSKHHQQEEQEEKTVEEDGLVWEKWEIGFKIHSIPNSYPSSSLKNTGHHLLFNPIGYLSAKSDKSSDHLESYRSIQHQLNQFLTRLIDFVLNERDHVPAITNSDLLPFPVDISILPASHG
ncbi:hypothetical protein PGT21_030514 [Puccinia graminis f. sp. tritici]|uniref:Autophagy-related protein 101 n=2 Tax=Puccinia graminis f. sp. tritici TaxID=56615 RepID=E3KRJ8_PUCGT|nr:uncharacterized protein PGTG_20271 [Puccinia graminis f. sp. tritici CRL 75-36-700-3]XP_003889354.1 uncharacterized protein PGTG_21911 [Puccinia graminis f. sp. tritici CRL 75-36-700-3]EFP94317.1 hypothetical protein PGTG_20271 [Puccinia graminis f. sp. tritici CRL 75-36-700-3]EHS63957.1 hypothetical protein PGTG_21911 [Puccinia graminis f. sp. tritici CRL 75-36-700-3]KAA1101808.1 hypothetical protein PGT21_030514 [Puccinia graminis f. sp. tritici]